MYGKNNLNEVEKMAIKVRKANPEGWNQGKIEDIYVDENVQTDFGIQDHLVFEIGLQNGSLLRRAYNFTLNPKSKLYPLAKGLFGEVHDDIDFETLIGTEWEFYLKPNKPGSTWMNITEVRPVQNTTSGTI